MQDIKDAVNNINQLCSNHEEQRVKLIQDYRDKRESPSFKTKKQRLNDVFYSSLNKFLHNGDGSMREVARVVYIVWSLLHSHKKEGILVWITKRATQLCVICPLEERNRVKNNQIIKIGDEKFAFTKQHYQNLIVAADPDFTGVKEAFDIFQDGMNATEKPSHHRTSNSHDEQRQPREVRGKQFGQPRSNTNLDSNAPQPRKEHVVVTPQKSEVKEPVVAIPQESEVVESQCKIATSMDQTELLSAEERAFIQEGYLFEKKLASAEEAIKKLMRKEGLPSLTSQQFFDGPNGDYVDGCIIIALKKYKTFENVIMVVKRISKRVTIMWITDSGRSLFKKEDHFKCIDPENPERSYQEKSAPPLIRHLLDAYQEVECC